MKTNQNSNLFAGLRSALCGLLLAAATSPGWAQNTNPTNTFDVASSTTSFVTWWGPPSPIMTWDSTLDAGGDANSGSARYEEAFTGTASEQFMTFFTIANRWGWDFGTILDATTYTNLSFDIRVDPSSGQRKNANDFGWLEIGLCTGTSPGTAYLPGRSIPLSAQGNWTHFDYPLNPTLAGIDQVSGFFIKMWSNGDHTNSLIFNIDNFMVTKPTVPVVIPPPTVSMRKPGPTGVEITMDNNADQWQRNGITTPANTGPYLWASQGSYPVTYSSTIADFPAAASHAGFEAHMYLVNGDTSGNNQVNGATDWSSPDIFIFRVENTAAGGARAQIQWKTNYPSSNATNIPVIVDVPSALGTWSVTFTDPTNGFLTGPGVTATNFTLPEDAVLNNFNSGSSYIQFGMFKNDGANDGHNNQAHGTYRRVTFNGAASPFDDSFSGPTLTNVYAWRKTSATAVQQVPPTAAWLIDWTLPATGFDLQGAAAVSGPWTAPVLITSYQGGGVVHTMIDHSALPNANSSFFRLIKRTFTQLQVLLPGESPAPNTPTGKTGTPTPVDLNLTGGVMGVTVRAVDSTWNLVSSATDLIHLTTTDGSAFTPPDARMVGGVATFTDINAIYFGTPGSYTVTATNMSRAMPEATSSSVTVQ